MSTSPADYNVNKGQQGMRADMDMLFGGSDDYAAPFATADTLASCAQYLEPILRGALMEHALLCQWPRP